MSRLQERAEFLAKVESVVKAAMPNIEQMGLVILPIGEYVIVTCKSGATYEICTEADSLMAMAYDIINFLRYK